MKKKIGRKLLSSGRAAAFLQLEVTSTERNGEANGKVQPHFQTKSCLLLAIISRKVERKVVIVTMVGPQ